jgi:hypothetical protein
MEIADAEMDDAGLELCAIVLRTGNLGGEFREDRGGEFHGHFSTLLAGLRPA